MKQSVQQVVTGALVGLMALGLAACGGGDAKVRGRVSNEAGTQAQGQVRAQGSLGGSGTVAAASQVRVSSVGQGGTLEAQGEAEVQAEGTYELSVPAGEERLVLQALDASGKVLASALLETSGEAGETAVAPPMDSESSLEAEVFLQMVKDGAQASETDTVDLRARLDARVARATAAGTAQQQTAWVKALAESMRAAQEARVKSLAKAGVTTSGDALFEAELAAAAKLNAALDANASANASTRQAYETFYAELAAAVQKVGAEAEEHAQSESSASAAFRISLDARLPSQDAQPLVDAAVCAAASLEARSSGAAVSALLQAAGATDAVKTQALSAATVLRTEADGATDAGDAANAFRHFSARVATDANVQTTVLGAFLGVSSSSALDVGLAVTATTAASSVLDSALDIAVDGAVDTTGGVNATALATGTADAYASFATGLRNQASVLARFGAKSTPAMELLIVAEGSFSGTAAQ